MKNTNIIKIIFLLLFFTAVYKYLNKTIENMTSTLVKDKKGDTVKVVCMNSNDKTVNKVSTDKEALLKMINENTMMFTTDFVDLSKSTDPPFGLSLINENPYPSEKHNFSPNNDPPFIIPENSFCS